MVSDPDGDMNFVSQLNRFLEPLRVRIRMIVSRAIVSLIDDSKNMQILQLNLMKDEVKSGVERVQNYGFTSHPKPDAQAVVVFIAGNRDHGLVVAVDDTRYRLKNLPEGGVAVYDFDGNCVKLTEANGIEIEAPNQKVTIKASGDIEIGNGSLKKLVNEEFKDLFNNHTHGYVEGTLQAGTYPVIVVPDPPPPLPPIGSPTAPPTDKLDNSHMTSKVKAE
jgi:phage baseplate assembly protein V